MAKREKTANRMQKKPKKQSIKERMFGIMMAFFVLFVCVLGRLGWLQIVRASWLQEKAVSQWTRSTTVSAKRGKITDTNGIVLAQSGSADTVEVTPQNIKEPEKVARAFEELLGLDYDTVYAKITDTSRNSVTIKRQITEEQSTALRAYGFKGVNFTVDTKRYYPLKNFLTQIIGYTTVDGTGQDGIEASQDKYLAGTPGRLVYEKDGSGREIPYGSEQYVEAQDGYNVALTVDAVVQSALEKAAEEALEVNQAKNVMGIVYDVRTGAIRGITTKPDFDLNDPPRNDYESLQSLSRNRVVADAYEPGSVFKILTLASALDSGVATENDTFNCPGYKIVDGQRIKCWSTRHGHQTLAEGVKNSCNPVFMELALRMGTETFYEYLYNFGLGSSTGSGLSGEAGGIVRNQKYVTNNDLARIGFGQSVAVTAIQMAAAVGAAINGGELMQPYIVKEIYSDDGTVIEKTEPTVVRRVVSEETSAIVREMLEGVVKEGSGKNCYIPGYRIGGKTGTSQKYENGAIAQGKNIASFLGFAPADDPQFLVYLLVDEPKVGVIYGSTVAAPFVRDIMQDLLKYYNIAPEYGEDGTGKTNATVPDVTGQELSAAQTALREAGFSSSADGTGTVIAQAPQAGARVPEGTQVQLYTSEPNESYELESQETVVPDLLGKTAGEAYEILKESGLNIQAAGAPRGKVVSQNPAAGRSALRGSSVSVVLEESGSEGSGD